jgi:hypothetical protein
LIPSHAISNYKYDRTIRALIHSLPRVHRKIEVRGKECLVVRFVCFDIIEKIFVGFDHAQLVVQWTVGICWFRAGNLLGLISLSLNIQTG